MLSDSPGGTLLKIRAIPGAKKSQLAGEENGRLKVRLQAPPLEGKANKALITLLACELGLKKNRLSLASGERSRDKVVLLKGVSLTEARVMIKSITGGE